MKSGTLGRPTKPAVAAASPLFQEKQTTGEVSCRTEVPSAARLPTGAVGGEAEAVTPYLDVATCTQEAAEEAAAAAQGPLPTSDPFRQEAAAERTASPTD
jgi:hypothetical protein